jgi:hypothetical protein
MKAYIVVEGESDEALIQAMLKARKLGRQVQVMCSHGESSALALARTLLAVKHVPVALVLDAGGTSLQQVDEQRRYLESMLGLAGPREAWEVILLVPEVEAVFFQVPGLWESMGLPPLSEVQKERARYEPKSVLQESLAKGPRRGRRVSPLDHLSRQPRYCEEIWKLEPFTRVASFLERVGESEAEPLLDGV